MNIRQRIKTDEADRNVAGSDNKDVRIAGPDDYQEVWRLGLNAFNENALFELNRPKVEMWVRRLLKIEPAKEGDVFAPRGVIAVIGDVGQLEAMAWIVIGEMWYTTQKHFEEFIVYVDPEHRKTSHAKKIVAWMKAQADACEVPLLCGIVSNVRTEAKCRLYRRMVPKAGEYFIHFGSKRKH